ncbi:hypothetical protein [Streptomyces sp. DH7]|uniref:hypothetical protein n=1 Tax=Streptomyces sp. DH7 TaxID=2857006 RepID=UPI001E33CF16|nr:hypothetical protein [Streptomyces sp. DH7]
MNPEPVDPRIPELETLLDVASRPGALSAAAEEKALHAFRTAHREGAHAAPPRRRRRRDDWRPVDERRRPRSFKALLAALVAAAALGGVAVAAGAGHIPSPFRGGAEPKPGQNAPTVPGAAQEPAAEGRVGRPPQHASKPTPRDPPSSQAPKASPKDRPGTARDTAAHCRVHLAAIEGRGKPPGDPATGLLEAAAGGREAVPGYCARLLAGEQQEKTGASGTEKSPERSAKPGPRNRPLPPTGPGAERDPGEGDVRLPAECGEPLYRGRAGSSPPC